MAQQYGISFLEDQGQRNGQQGNGMGPAPSPLQSVVKLLSLRLPSVVGARALAPQALLSGGAAPPSPMGGGGMGGGAALGANPNAAEVLQWLQMLLSGGGGGGEGMARPPLPSFTPGLGGAPSGGFAPMPDGEKGGTPAPPSDSPAFPPPTDWNKPEPLPYSGSPWTENIPRSPTESYSGSPMSEQIPRTGYRDWLMNKSNL